jgi:hypothetical protein
MSSLFYTLHRTLEHTLKSPQLAVSSFVFWYRLLTAGVTFFSGFPNYPRASPTVTLDYPTQQPNPDNSRILCTDIKSKPKLYYERRSVDQSVLVSGTHLGPTTNFSRSLFNYLYTVAGLLMWGAFSDEKSGEFEFITYQREPDIKHFPQQSFYCCVMRFLRFPLMGGCIATAAI